MKSPKAILLAFLLLSCLIFSSLAQDDDYGGGEGDEAPTPPAPPPQLEHCNGFFLSYAFISREKLFPHKKNTSAQGYAFKSTASIFNAGSDELKAWKMYIGFQHNEIIVSVDKGVLAEGGEFPAAVGKNGTYISGDALPDLKTSEDTAGDWSQIQASVDIKGTQFGVKPPGVPMPKTIRLANDGYKCPAPVRQKTEMHVCCVRDPKFKKKKTKPTKFLPHRDGDLIITYDVVQAYKNNYQVQVTMENNHPLGRLDNWNLTWEWKRGEFIYSMQGAYTHTKDPSECIYGPAGTYYQEFDFTPVMNCAKKPIISDLPPTKAKDEKVGNIPFCCRNGSLLPPSMDETKSKASFTMLVYKVPPDMNRTALFPPQNWKINGVVNPNYKCGAPIRVNPTEFPDATGLDMVTTSIATWEIVCNIARPKKRQSHCCVSFSAFYNESVIPCNTCSCGCDDDSETCSPDASSLLLPPEALLVPFENRTAKAKAWAKIKHFRVPKTLPCGDNCGVSIHWHINSDYKSGWSARITLFNWETYIFENWFAAIHIPKAYRGFEDVYSFNGSTMPELENTIIFQGLPGLNYLMGMTNGTNQKVNIPVPGKQQSVISFKKTKTPGINIAAGDGFPEKIYFNGEECQLPDRIPLHGTANRSRISLLPIILFAVIVFVIATDYI